jgi:hypothetical protein
MTDQVLTILKFVLLGLLYLFFARVLWAVWSEVRTPSQRPMIGSARKGVPSAPANQTTPMGRPAAAAVAAAPAAGTTSKKAKKSKKTSSKRQRGRATRLVVLEPRSRRGATIALGGDIVLGRDPASTIMIDDDAYISQRHVRFYEYEGQPMVEDLGSTNGTFHNGSKLTGSKLLHPGDRVQAGITVIEAQ